MVAETSIYDDMVDDKTYKWVVIYEGSGDFKGGIFADSMQVAKFVGVSDSTIRRKIKNNEFFYIDKYRIMKLEYFKSNRGG